MVYIFHYDFSLKHCTSITMEFENRVSEQVNSNGEYVELGVEQNQSPLLRVKWLMKIFEALVIFETLTGVFL